MLPRPDKTKTKTGKRVETAKLKTETKTETGKTKMTAKKKADTKTKTDEAQVCEGMCHGRDGGTVGFRVLCSGFARRPVLDK
jgi:hypothetical protein